MPKHLQAFLCFLLLLKGATAQNAFPQDTTRRFRIDAAVALVKQLPAEASSLYNGREHIMYNPLSKGHAYFASKGWQKATIVYDGITYTGVPALLDLVKDELIILHYNNSFGVQLVKEKISRFSIADQHFTHVIADSTNNLRPGFYQILHNGNTMLLAKRSKVIEHRTTTLELETHFLQKDQYTIINKGKYHTVRSSGTLLTALADRRKAVQQYLRKHRIRFRKDPETTIVRAVTFYDAPQN